MRRRLDRLPAAREVLTPGQLIEGNVPQTVVLLTRCGLTRLDAVEELGTSGIKAYVMVNVLRKGRIRVKAGGTIADGDRLYYQTSTGKWVNAAVALDTINMTAQVLARTSGALNELITAEVDMTNKS